MSSPYNKTRSLAETQDDDKKKSSPQVIDLDNIQDEPAAPVKNVGTVDLDTLTDTQAPQKTTRVQKTQKVVKKIPQIQYAQDAEPKILEEGSLLETSEGYTPEEQEKIRKAKDAEDLAAQIKINRGMRELKAKPKLTPKEQAEVKKYDDYRTAQRESLRQRTEAFATSYGKRPQEGLIGTDDEVKRLQDVGLNKNVANPQEDETGKISVAGQAFIDMSSLAGLKGQALRDAAAKKYASFVGFSPEEKQAIIDVAKLKDGGKGLWITLGDKVPVEDIEDLKDRGEFMPEGDKDFVTYTDSNATITKLGLLARLAKVRTGEMNPETIKQYWDNMESHWFKEDKEDGVDDDAVESIKNEKGLVPQVANAFGWMFRQMMFQEDTIDTDRLLNAVTGNKGRLQDSGDTTEAGARTEKNIESGKILASLMALKNFERTIKTSAAIQKVAEKPDGRMLLYGNPVVYGVIKHFIPDIDKYVPTPTKVGETAGMLSPALLGTAGLPVFLEQMSSGLKNADPTTYNTMMAIGVITMGAGHTAGALKGSLGRLNTAAIQTGAAVGQVGSAYAINWEAYQDPKTKEVRWENLVRDLLVDGAMVGLSPIEAAKGIKDKISKPEPYQVLNMVVRNAETGDYAMFVKNSETGVLETRRIEPAKVEAWQKSQKEQGRQYILQELPKETFDSILVNNSSTGIKVAWDTLLGRPNAARQREKDLLKTAKVVGKEKLVDGQPVRTEKVYNPKATFDEQGNLQPVMTDQRLGQRISEADKEYSALKLLAEYKAPLNTNTNLLQADPKTMEVIHNLERRGAIRIDDKGQITITEGGRMLYEQGLQNVESFKAEVDAARSKYGSGEHQDTKLVAEDFKENDFVTKGDKQYDYSASDIHLFSERKRKAIALEVAQGRAEFDEATGSIRSKFREPVKEPQPAPETGTIKAEQTAAPKSTEKEPTPFEQKRQQKIKNEELANLDFRKLEDGETLPRTKTITVKDTESGRIITFHKDEFGTYRPAGVESAISHGRLTDQIKSGEYLLAEPKGGKKTETPKTDIGQNREGNSIGDLYWSDRPFEQKPETETVEYTGKEELVDFEGRVVNPKQTAKEVFQPTKEQDIFKSLYDREVEPEAVKNLAKKHGITEDEVARIFVRQLENHLQGSNRQGTLFNKAKRAVSIVESMLTGKTPFMSEGEDAIKLSPKVVAQEFLNYFNRKGRIHLDRDTVIDISDPRWKLRADADLEVSQADPQRAYVNSNTQATLGYLIHGEYNADRGLTVNEQAGKIIQTQLRKIIDADRVKAEHKAGLTKLLKFLEDNENKITEFITVSPENTDYMSFRTTSLHERVHKMLAKFRELGIFRDEAIIRKILVTPEGRKLRELIKNSDYAEIFDRPNQIAQEVMAMATDLNSLHQLGVKEEDLPTYSKVYVDLLKAINEEHGEHLAKAVEAYADPRVREVLQQVDDYDQAIRQNRLPDASGGRGISENARGGSFGEAGIGTLKAKAEDWRGSGVKSSRYRRLTFDGNPLSLSGIRGREHGQRVADNAQPTLNFYVEKPDGTFAYEDALSSPRLLPFDIDADFNLIDMATDPVAWQKYTNLPFPEFQKWAESQGYHGFFSSGDLLPDVMKYRMSLFGNEEVKSMLQPQVLFAKNNRPAPDPSMMAELSTLHQTLPHNPDAPEVKKAYDAFKKETAKQFKDVIDSGVKVEEWKGKDEDYLPYLENIGTDIRENKHLFYQSSRNVFGNEKNDNSTHPLMEESGLKDSNGKPLLYNDLFRVTHDVYGHTPNDYRFGVRGEFNAFAEHSKMYSEDSLPALMSETLMQSAVVAEKNYKYANGRYELTRDPQQLIFADQKAIVPPKDMVKKVMSTVKDVEVLKSKAPQQNGFYSAVEEAILSGRMPKKAKASDYLNILRNTQGVKKDELDWSGLGDWLGGKGDEVISVDQLKVKAHYGRVTIKDIIYSEKSRDVLDDKWWALNSEASKIKDELDKVLKNNEYNREHPEYKRLNKEFQKVSTEMQKVSEARRNTKTPTWHTYDGGSLVTGGDAKDHVEIVVQIPRLVKGRTGEAPEYTPENIVEVNRVNGKIIVTVDDYGTLTDYYAKSSTYEEARREVLEQLNGDETIYQSGHWDEENVIYHIRGSGRTTTDGINSFLIDEIQSDLHQEAREKGYGLKVDERVKELEAEYAKLVADSPNVTPETGKEYGQKIAAIKNELEGLRFQNDIPDAPLKETWHEQAFKKALRYAVENGYDRILWTTGRQQIERNQNALRQNVDKIEYKTHTPQTALERESEISTLEKQLDKLYEEQDALEEKLEEHLKQELADKGKTLADVGEEVFNYITNDHNRALIRENIGALEKQLNSLKDERGGEYGKVRITGFKDGKQVLRHYVPLEGSTAINNRNVTLDNLLGKKMADEVRANGSGEFSGDSLSIGGAMHKLLYDEKIPNFAKKYAKKWGGEVGSSKIYVESVGAGNRFMVVRHPKDASKFEVVTEFGGTPDQYYKEGYSTEFPKLFDSSQEAKAEIARLENLDRETLKTDDVHSLTITPEMRESVLDGQLLFAKSPEDAAGLKQSVAATLKDDPEAVKQNRRMQKRYDTPAEKHTKTSMKEVLLRGNWSALSAVKNGDESKMSALKKDLDMMGYRYIETEGVFAGESEKSLVVYYPREVSSRIIQALGNKYKQDAVLHGVGGKYTMEFSDGQTMESQSIHFQNGKNSDRTNMVLRDGKLDFNIDFDWNNPTPAPEGYSLKAAEAKIEARKKWLDKPVLTPEEMRRVFTGEVKLEDGKGRTIDPTAVYDEVGQKVGRVEIDEDGREYVKEVSAPIHWTDDTGLRGILESGELNEDSSFTQNKDVPFDVDNNMSFGVRFNEDAVTQAGYRNLPEGKLGVTALEQEFELKGGGAVGIENIDSFVVRTERAKKQLQRILNEHDLGQTPIEVIGKPQYKTADQPRRVYLKDGIGTDEKGNIFYQTKAKRDIIGAIGFWQTLAQDLNGTEPIAKPKTRDKAEMDAYNAKRAETWLAHIMPILRQWHNSDGHEFGATWYQEAESFAKKVGRNLKDVNNDVVKLWLHLTTAITSPNTTVYANTMFALNAIHSLVRFYETGKLVIPKFQYAEDGTLIIKPDGTPKKLGLGSVQLEKTELLGKGFIPAGSIEGQYLISKGGKAVRADSLVENSVRGDNMYVFSPTARAMMENHGQLQGILNYLLSPSLNNQKFNKAVDIYGDKLGAFMSNLMGLTQIPTIDTWMNRYFRGLTGDAIEVTRDKNGRITKVKDNSMNFDEMDGDLFRGVIQKAVEDFNKETGNKLTPADAQAIIWTQVKDLFNSFVKAEQDNVDFSEAYDMVHQKLLQTQGDLFGDPMMKTPSNPELIADAKQKAPLVKGLTEGTLKDNYGQDFFIESHDGVSLAMKSNGTLRAKSQKIDMSDPALVAGDFDAWVDVASRLVKGGFLADGELKKIKELSGDPKNVDKLQEYVLGLNKMGVLELFTGLLRVNPLVGVKNIVRNTTSNSLNQFANEIARIPSFIIDIGLNELNRATGGVNYERTVLAPSLISTSKALVKALTSGTYKAGKFFIKGGAANFEHPALFRDRTTGWGVLKPLEIYMKYGFRLQESADIPFKTFAFYRSLDELVKIKAKKLGVSVDEAMTHMTSEDFDQAFDVSLNLTFQDSNIISDKYYKLRDGQSPLLRAIMDLQVPYIKTPLNVVKTVLNYSGFFPLIKGLNKQFSSTEWLGWRENAAKVLDNPQDRQAIAYGIGRGMVGWTTAYIGFKLGAAGLLTSFFDKDDRKENDQMGAKGASYGSIQVGDYSVDISSLLPTSFYLLAGAAWAQAEKERIKKLEKDPNSQYSTGVAAVSTILKNLALQTPLVGTAVRLYDDNESRLKSGKSPDLSRLLGVDRAVPAIVAETAQTMDKKERVIDNKDVLTKATQTIQSKIPVWREQLPARYDMLGREIEAPYGFDPLKTRKVKDEPLVNELDRFDLNVNVEKGSALEMNEARRQKGQYFTPALENVVKDPMYQEASDEYKKKMLEDTIRYLNPEFKKDKLPEADEKHNLMLIRERNSFLDKLAKNPQQFAKDAVFTDKRLVNNAKKIGISEIKYSDIVDFMKSKGLEKFIQKQFLYNFAVSDDMGRDEAERNLKEFKADPMATMVKWYVSQREYDERSERLSKRRSELSKQGKSEAEIDKILHSESARLGWKNRKKAQTEVKVTAGTRNFLDTGVYKPSFRKEEPIEPTVFGEKLMNYRQSENVEDFRKGSEASKIARLFEDMTDLDSLLQAIDEVDFDKLNRAERRTLREMARRDLADASDIEEDNEGKQAIRTLIRKLGDNPRESRGKGK